MRFSLTLFRRVFVLSLLATSAFAQPVASRSGLNDVPRVEPSLAFGAKIIDIALTFDAAAEQSLLAAPDMDVPAQMIFMDASGAQKSADVKIHIKGQFSRRRLGSKPAFKVKLDQDDRFFGLEHLTLNNMVQDPTMVHEALGYQVYEAAGVKVPATGYARVTVNGEAYGLYLNLETPDTHFLKRRFGDDSGILYEGPAGVDLRAGDVEKFELDEGEDRNRATLKELIRSLDTPGDDIFYGAVPKVDTASFLGMMAAEALLGDWDSYYTSNNYRIYWNPSVSRWFFIPTGIDQSFNSTTVFGATGLLFQKCLASERCTRDYADTVQDVASRFERLDLPAKMDALLSVIDQDAQADPKKPYDAKKMTSARDAMLAFIAKRPAKVRAALSCMEGGREATVGACAGAVMVNAAVGQCVGVAADNAEQKSIVVSVSPCDGAASQRWRLIARDDVLQLAVASSGNCLDVTDGSQRDGTELQQLPCTGLDSQLFSLRPLAEGTQLVAKHSGKCVAVAPGNPQGAALIQVTCALDAAQTWQIQRSIYK
jgi:CotH protein/ricin-type beta-trefoil lectin protein